MKRIDAHMHVCQWFSDDGSTAFEALKRYQIENEIEHVDIMCCSNESNLWSGYEPDQNIIAAITKLEVPSTYIHGCMTIPNEIGNENFEKQVEELYAIGFDGIKCCEYKPDSYKIHKMDGRKEAYERLFSWCEKKRFPVCMHVADPDTFWDETKVSDWAKKAGWFYGDGTYPTWEYLYELTYGILERHKDLDVMLAHAYFLSHHPDRVRALFKKYPRLTIDLAPGWEMFEGFRLYRDDWTEIFNTYSDRILYATDADTRSSIHSCSKLAKDVHRFLSTDDTFTTNGDFLTRGIALEEAHLDKILYTNAKRIVGNNPRPIDKKLLKEYIYKNLSILPETENRKMIEKYVKERL